MDVNQDDGSPKDTSLETTTHDASPQPGSSSVNELKTTEMNMETETVNAGDQVVESTNTADNLIPNVGDTASHDITFVSPPRAISPTKFSSKKTPPPYQEAYYTSNTLSILSLPNQPLQSTRDTFFPSIPVLPPSKPKPCARCPITGLPARYRDPLSGIGYYDIHAFKILREVGKKGSRYVWCSEGGWFVGETGWGGRGAKGVPDGWTV
jgi:hypothetical protein